MKNILKILLVFILGLAVGCGVTAFVMNKIHKNYLAELYSMDLSEKAMQARMLRQGETELISQTLENGLPEYVLAIHGNEELKNADLSAVALAAAKKFYVCTKTEIPPEIAEILNNLPPEPHYPCEIEDRK